MAKTTSHSYRIYTLIQRVEDGEIVFPNFQRGFVWRQKDVIRLLDSIYHGYPIGTLLFWRTTDASILGSQPDRPLSTIVIDGVQRLRALRFTLFPEPGKEHAKMRIGFDLESQEFAPISDSRLSKTTVPLDTIYSPAGLVEVQMELARHSNAKELLQRLNQLYNAFLNYEVSVMWIGEASLDDVLMIFTRLNTSGARLSKADIERAKNQPPPGGGGWGDPPPPKGGPPPPGGGG